MPESLKGDVAGGREFLQDMLLRIQIADHERMTRICPVCGETQGTINPRHMKWYGLTMEETYRRYAELCFNKKARLHLQPTQDGILPNTKMLGLVVAGAGFEPATFGL